MGKSKGWIICLLLSLLVGTAFAADRQAFKQAIEPRPLVFPQDHASHAGFQTEWWYFTGNVYDAAGRRFGYQFTFFRRAADPLSAQARGRKSRWAASDFFLGHLAISDLASKEFHFEEAAARDALGLSGATEASDPAAAQGMRVWLHDWELTFADKRWRIKAAAGRIALDLSLEQTLPPILHGRPGEEGLSRKGSQPGQASYYYSLPGLKTTGTLSIDGKQTTLTSGLSWMDHEAGSSQLSAEQVGWDWFAIQLSDGSALMLYLLRRKDGSLEPSSSGTWISTDGKSTHVPLDQIQFTRAAEWISPASQRRYALEWTLKIPKHQIELTVKAAQQNQEIRGNKSGRISYYEGATDITGTVAGKAATGTGYLEITGAPGGKAGEIEGLGGRL